jgi:hypothetical protein
MNAALYLKLLLLLYRPPVDIRHLLEARVDRIIEQAEAAAVAHDVPPSILLTVAFLETHLGADPGEAGGWGSPVDRFHRHTAGTADSAARDLATSYRVCGGWLAALRRYRTGLCYREPAVGYTARTAARIIRRVHARAGIAPPL